METDFDKQWKDIPSGNTEFNETRVKEFLKFTRLPRSFFKGKRCLDAGCGNGRYTYAMMELGGIVDSLDISEEGVKHCKVINKNTSLCNITELSENRVYDFVLCWGVLHHTENPRESFRRVASQVKHGGLLHIMVYNKDNQEIYREGRRMWKDLSSQGKLNYCNAKVGEIGGDLHGWWDALNPTYNFSFNESEIKKWFDDENFIKTRLTKKHNINMQGLMR